MLLRDAITAYQKNYAGKGPTTDAHLTFWLEQLGNQEVKDISALDVDDVISILIRRPAQTTVRKKIGIDGFGKNIYEVRRHDLARPKSESTLNRYIPSLGSVFRFIKKMRFIRGFISPISGVEKFKGFPNVSWSL